MTLAEKVDALNREHWMLSEVVSMSAKAIDATTCAGGPNNADKEYTAEDRAKLVDVISSVHSVGQLENCVSFFEAALDEARAKRDMRIDLIES